MAQSTPAAPARTSARSDAPPGPDGVEASATTAAPGLAPVVALVVGLALAGCASRAPRVPAPADPGADGPPAFVPPDLARRPDAVPRIEPLRRGGPNKPYVIGGQLHIPLTDDLPFAETGLASWYGRRFHGRPTASGEPYDMLGMTAAHRTMPIPSYAVVTNPANGRRVVVRVNDRGPFVDGRVIDLSYAAALKLGVLAAVAPVEVRRLTHADIRAGEAAALVAPGPLAHAALP